MEINMTKVLVFAGKKQSGKDSAANFLTGFLLREAGVIDHFDINEKGQLEVNAVFRNSEGNEEHDMGVLDLNRGCLGDWEFIDYASNRIWPVVKVYHFADKLKQIAHQVFGIPLYLMYGTDAEKRELTNIEWKAFSKFMAPRNVKKLKDEGLYDKKMSIREFLKHFGTDVCRHLVPGCWRNHTFSQIADERPAFAIIADGRFANEITTDEDLEIKTIYFTKQIEEDNHKSENGFDDVEDFDVVIDNQDMTIKEKNEAVLNALLEWGWLKPVMEEASV
jgi:hypothetical protein